MASPRQWWRRAKATAKDRWSIYVTRVVGGARHRHHLHRRSPEVEAAVIRATSHDDRSVDYKSAGRVFTWARGAPSSLLPPLMWSVAHRASRTRSWIVALKCLLLAHGLLLCSDDAPPSAHVGRLPFDLSDFRGRSSASPGFSAFVRAYYRFVDRRSFFSALTGPPSQAASGAGDQDDDLEQLERLQVLLDLLMQIRPYADGMEVSLVLEAMDCVVIEIFEVYSSICSGIAHFLVGILGPDQYGAMTEARRRRGRVGMRILRRAVAQNSQLSSYFDLCRALGVLNATELPPVEGIPEKDMDDLERLVLGGTTGSDEGAAAVAVAGNGGGRAEQEVQGKKSEGHFGTVITKEWVVFDDEGHCGKEERGHFGHSTCRSPDNIWPSTLWAQREWQSHPSDLNLSSSSCFLSP
ncbi:hypothetical protein BHM03_00050141 [Ensete ventricosum]|nr:hypothetical protein BHM03_00050141 [Ensete ventricosum]